MKSLSNTAVTLDITKLTECTLEGSGVLDKLLHTARVHLQDEFQQGRITGKEYSNAYIAIYDRMVQSAIAYALAAEKAPYEIAQLEAQTALTEEQRKQVEEETRYRLPAEIQQIQAQTELITQQKLNLIDELLTAAKQRLQIEAQTALISYQKDELLPAQTANQKKQTELLEYDLTQIKPHELAIKEKQAEIAEFELLNKLPAELAQLGAQTALITQQKVNLTTEALNIPKQGLVLDGQVSKLNADTQLTSQQKTNLVADGLNIPKQGELIDAQVIATLREGDLREQQILLAEKDVLLRDKELSIKEQQLLLAAEELLLKAEEIEVAKAQSKLYDQKVITEKAQVDSSVVGAGSVIDTNNKLLNAQADAYEKEQVIKAVKLAMDTFITGYTNGDRWGNTANLQNDNTLGILMERMGTTIGVTLSHIPATGDGGNVNNPAP